MSSFYKGILFGLLCVLAGKSTAQQLSARDYFLLGAAKFKCNACEYAQEDFSRAIALDQRYAEAYYGRSLSYNCLGRYEEALRDIDRAIRIDGQQVLYREAKARIRTASGDLKGGTREFQRALAMDSLCWQAWYGWARNAHNEKEYVAARKAYNKSIALSPQFPMARLWRGKMELDLEQYGDARDDLTRAAELAPEYAPVYEWRSLTFLRMQEHAPAIEDATRALNLDPQSAQAYYFRGLAKLATQKYADADVDFAEAIKLDKQKADAYFRRGICHERQGDLTGARKYFSQAIKRERILKAAYVERALVWRKMEKPKKAVKDITSALAIERDDIKLILDRGFLYLELEEPQNAIHDFSRVILLDPKQAAAFFGLGNAVYAEGNVRKACSDWRTALDLGDDRAADQINKYCVE
ncbi:MAG: tetratricopeptide repeat protein [Bacteroidota bacterium]